MSPEPQVLSYQLKSFWVPGRKLGLSFASVKTRSIWKESSKYAQHRHSGRTSACRRMGMQFLMPVISDGVSHQSLPLVVNLCLSLMLSASVCSSSLFTWSSRPTFLGFQTYLVLNWGFVVFYAGLQ